MAGNISRDEISVKVFGAKFASLTTDNKQWVNKTMSTLYRVGRQGMDTEHMLSMAAMQETAKIVKQLKEIVVNPGDVIELPTGVYKDAARVIRYQAEVMGKGKTFSRSDLARLSSEIKRKFGDVDTEVISGIAEYLTNTKGGYRGVGPRTLRKELRSFLDYERLDKLSNKEIVAARDIVVASIFDKWSKGNLTSYIKPRIKEQIERPLNKSDLQKTVNALETLEHLQSNPSKLNSPVVRQALKNLGLSPSQIVDTPAKTAVSNIQHAAHEFASRKARGRSDILLGGGLRRRPRLLTRASPEYLKSIPGSYPISGVGKKTTIRSRWSGGSFKTHLPRLLDSDESGSGGGSYDYLASELVDFSYATAEEEYGTWTRELQKKYSKFMDKGPGSVTEYTTGLISPYVVAGSLRESNSQLQRVYHDLYLERMTEHEDVRANYTKRYGRYYGKLFHEAGIPFDKADEMVMTYESDKAMLKSEIESYTSGLARFDKPIGVEKDEIKPFNPRQALAGFYGEMGNSSVGNAVREFMNQYPGATPADLPDEIARLVRSGGSGATRVGVVGSKSWDNEPFMRKFFRKNWDSNNVMVTSAGVGKGINDTNFGAEYQASNWAHHAKAFLHKLPVRGEWFKTSGGKDYQKDLTIADVVNNSDEVVAFFDEAYLSPSGKTQLTNLLGAIGDKPLRIVWVPTNLTKAKGSTSFIDMMSGVANRENITFDAFHPGALPKSLISNIVTHDIPLKYLAKGGKLKHGENAIVGEAGPEMLLSRPGGGFDVIPNKQLRFLAEGTLPLASYARNVTNEPQADEHDYVDPATGEIWPSVTKIKNLGKNYTGGAYYGHVGSVAHYYAAIGLGERHGIDTSHIKFPEVNGDVDLQGRFHSVENILETGKAISEKFLELADQMGFVPALIEQRFVNTRDKYSGTLDIAGFVRDEIGNLIPTIADFKSSSKVDPDFAEQIAGYADFFQDAVKGFVINVTRDLGSMGVYEMDLVKGFEGWQKKLSAYNAKFGPRPIKGGDADAAAMRMFELQSRQMEIFDVAAGEKYVRQGIAATTPGHARALSKVFPKFGAVGNTPDYTWDKNPSRLAVFSARLDELFGAGGAGVHPMISKALSELMENGWNADSLKMIAHADVGVVEDDPATIKLFDRIYQSLKPTGFNQKLLDSGDSMQAMLWNDSITLLNILEEAGKSFESVPRFANKLKTSSSVPGPGLPGVPPSASPGTPQIGLKKCKGVDLCEPTMSKFESWFKGIKIYGGTGGSGGSKPTPGGGRGGSTPGENWEQLFKEQFLDNVPHATGYRKMLERLPIAGLPFQMKRKEKVYGERILEAEQSNVDWQALAPKGYWKLLEKEDQARKNYLRSIRGATTSYLIAAHVMRIFGQTSKVYNKAHESIGQGIGYISDMFLIPVLPYLAPFVKGLVGIGNIVRQFPAITAVGVYALWKVVRGTYAFLKGIEQIPAAVHNATEAILNMLYNMQPVPTGMPDTGPVDTHQYRTPIGPEQQKESPFARVKRILGFSRGGVVPGTGNKDSVLAMLTPGEVVISKDNLPHYADGGIVGGVVGNVLGMYGDMMSTDIAQSIIGGLSVVSKSIGAMMAPMAPVLAVGAMAGRGWNAVKTAINKGTAITANVSEGGFRALRTIATAQLVGNLTSLAPLVPIAAAVAGVYAWTQGYGAIMRSGVSMIRDAVRGFWDWVKSFFDSDTNKGTSEPKAKESKAKYGDHKSRMWMVDETERPPEEKKAEEEAKKTKTKGIWERITDKAPWLRGVPGMTLLGGVIGAAESKNPIDWAKSGILGGAAQVAFNVGESVLNKLKLPGGSIMGGVGGFLAGDFGKHIGKAFVSGEGPLGIGKYFGLQGNSAAEKSLGLVATQALIGTSIPGNVGAWVSDLVGGIGLKNGIIQQILSGTDKMTGDFSAMGEMYKFGYNYPTLAPAVGTITGSGIITGGGEMRSLVEISKGIQQLIDNTKQPTINQVHIEMANSDPYALFQQFQQWLASLGNTSGVQNSY